MNIARIQEEERGKEEGQGRGKRSGTGREGTERGIETALRARMIAMARAIVSEEKQCESLVFITF